MTKTCVVVKVENKFQINQIAQDLHLMLIEAKCFNYGQKILITNLGLLYCWDSSECHMYLQ